MKRNLTPPFIKNIIIINLGFFIFSFFSSLFGFDLNKIFGLVPYLFLKEYYFWQLFSYLFMHGNALHLFFNMLMLWMFGIELYYFFGKTMFIKYYFVCGIGAGLTVIVLTSIDTKSYYIPTVGASGAIFGLFLAYGWFFKDRILYAFGVIPIKARTLVIILALIEFFTLFSSQNSIISHTAHIGGLVFGFIYLKYKEKEKALLKHKYDSFKKEYNDKKEDNKIKWN